MLSPPLFKDEEFTAISLSDTTAPLREVYFKVEGRETEPISDFVTISDLDATS